MLQSVSSVFIVYRCKTLTGSPDPMHENGMNKPCIIGLESGQAEGGAQAPPKKISPVPEISNPKPGSSKDPTQEPTKAPTEDPTQDPTKAN